MARRVAQIERIGSPTVPQGSYCGKVVFFTRVSPPWPQPFAPVKIGPAANAAVELRSVKHQ